MESVASSPDQPAVEDAGPAAAKADWVVVSSCLEDLPWCDWLFREFDGERVPRPLLGRPSRDGLPYPDRISVTPDPADPFQLAELGSALRRSQHLIVIVSPNSGNDKTMTEHMRIFKGAGGEQRIIALVVNGEPASPAAAPASEADREWLPKWLEWRFEGNRFNHAGPEEPLVVDARLGAGSLAEVRMCLFAAILEVPRAELSDLGVVMRTMTDVRELPAPTAVSRVPVEDMTPTPNLMMPPLEPPSSASRWPLILCGAGAIAALGFLAFGPAGVPARPRVAEPVAKVADADVPSAPGARPMTAVVALPADPLPDFAPPPAKAAAPALSVETPGASTSIVPTMDPAEQLKRELAVISAKRDRLVRLAETQSADGHGDNALTTFRDALDAAKQILNRGNGNVKDAVALAAIQHRIGYLAANVSSSAEARAAYADGRSVLLSLRNGGELPADGAKLLQEIEAGIRAVPRD